MNAQSVKTLYLIDGTAQLFRAYFAIPGLTDERGMPTNAIYGFATMLRKLLREERPTHVAAAFDLGGDVFRHEVFADYKANRPPVPEDLHVQVPFAKRVCEAFGVQVIEREGFEADDLIATCARRARAQGFDVVVVAADKDLMQLVGPGVTLLNPTKNLRLDARGVATEFGVPPERVRDVLGLMGDAVDNIPGVPGVGDKTARALVLAYGELDAVLARAERTVGLFEARDDLLAAVEALGTEDGGVDPVERVSTAGERFVVAADALATAGTSDDLADRACALRTLVDAAGLAGLPRAPAEAAKRLRALKRALKDLDRGSARRVWQAVHENRDAARLSRDLATLHDGVPFDLGIDELARRRADTAGANALFASLGFRSLVADDAASEDPAVGTQAALAVVRGPVVVGEYEHVTDDEESLARVASTVATARKVAIVASIRGDDRLAAPLDGIALAWAEGRGAFVSVGVGGVSVDLLNRMLGSILAGEGAPTVTHDAKRQAQILFRHGLPFDARGLDLMVAAFLLDPGRADYSAERLVAEIGGLGPRARALESLDATAVAHDRAEDADRLLRLAARLEPQLDATGLRELYDRIDGPLLPVLARMEARGIRIDTGLLAAMSVEMDAQIRTEREAIHELAGREFNIDSTKQLREVLFDGLGLATRRKTRKGRVASTDAQTLEELASEHAIARRILEYRELTKLKGTYVDALPRLVRADTGRVHTTFDPTGAATGRLSSFDPNLQNIPVRTEAGRRIRAAFVPEPGSVFLSADYSQVELRVLAHLAGDDELIAAFRSGEDIHRYTAARVFGVPGDLVTDAMRQRAKAVNFGILYGMSETRLAREQGMARSDAGRFIEAYFARFSGVRRYIDRTREAARRDGHVRTLFGRVRWFPVLEARAGRAEQEQALRAAVNTTIQGTAADLMKLAMLRVDAELERAGTGAHLLLQVHDELLLELPRDRVDEVGRIVREAMEGVAELAVPLVVEPTVGASWLEAG